LRKKRLAVRKKTVSNVGPGPPGGNTVWGLSTGKEDWSRPRDWGGTSSTANGKRQTLYPCTPAEGLKLCNLLSGEGCQLSAVHFGDRIERWTVGGGQESHCGANNGGGSQQAVMSSRTTLGTPSDLEKRTRGFGGRTNPVTPGKGGKFCEETFGLQNA